MYATFDVESKTLRIGKLQIPNDFVPYQDSDMFTAYKKYFIREDEGPNIYCLRNDFRDIVAQIRNNLTKFSEFYSSEFDVKFEVAGIRYGDKDYHVGRSDYMVTTVLINLIINGEKIPKLQGIPLMRFPYMNRFGIIEKDGMEYAVQAAMEPSKYITYDAKPGAKTLDIMLHAYKVSFVQHGKSINILFNNNSKSKVDLTSFVGFIYFMHKEMNNREDAAGGQERMLQGIGSLSYEETLYNRFIPNIEKEFSNIDTDGIVQLMENQMAIETIKQYGTPKMPTHNQLLNSRIVYLEMFGFAKDSTHITNPYDLDDLRDELNEMLSIDRALGRTLAEDIVITRNLPGLSVPGELLARSGEIVSNDTLIKCHKNHINRIRVTRKESYHLQQTAVAIQVRKIPKGFVINDEIRNGLISGVTIDEDVASTDIILEEGECIIPNYTTCTPSVIDVVLNCDCCFMFHWESQDKLREIHERMYRQQAFSYMSDNVPTKHHYVYCWENIYDKQNNKTNETRFMKTVLFTETIVGNNHFKDDNEQWYYWCADQNGMYNRFTSSRLLTFYDLLAMVSFLPELYNGNYIDRVSDKDLGIRKKVATIDAQFNRVIRDNVATNFASNVARAIQGYRSKGLDLRNTQTTLEEGLVKKLTEACNMFYRGLWENLSGKGYKYVKLVDKSNPISYVSSINQVATLVKDAHGVPIKARFMAMGSYGRTCGFETPASQKLGLTNNIACRAKIIDGKIYTPYYKVLHVGGKIIVPFETGEPEYLSVIQEESEIIADIMSLDLDVNGRGDDDQFVLARVPSSNKIEKLTLECVPAYMVTYVNVWPDQSIGHSATTIPFIGRVDATRVTYGVSMAKQAVPLVNREIPRVVTDSYQSLLWKTQKYQINAEANGTVESISTKPISGPGYLGSIDITVRYDKPIRKYAADDPFGSATEADRCIEVYSCTMAEFSDKCVILRKIEVNEGQRVKAGDILVSSNYTKDNYIAIGINALVAEIPTGYNYEDGVQMSYRLRDKMTSYSRKGTIVKPPCEASPADRNYMVYIQYNNEYIFRWNPKSNLTKLKGSEAFASSKMITGFPVAIYAPPKKGGSTQKVSWRRKIESIEISPINTGDKTANRHGNKGVDANIIENSQMLCLDNGEFFDLVYNPNGAASRMNLSQLTEMPIALASYIVDCRLQVMPYNEGDLPDLYDYYYYIWRCIEEGVDAATHAKPYWIPQNFVDYIKTQESRMLNWRGILDDKCKARVYDPKTGQYLKQRAVIGINYVMKLVQMSEHKANARGGPFTNDQSYKAMDARPDKGAKVQGGQSIGYMEANALLAHGADNLLYELQHEKGDDLAARQIMMIDHLLSENDDSPLAQVLSGERGKLVEIRERRSLTKFRSILRGLGMDIEVVENDEGYPILPNDLNEYKDAYFLRDNFIKGQQIVRKSESESSYTSDSELFQRNAGIEDEGIE